jgi:hypothetical protein
MHGSSSLSFALSIDHGSFPRIEENLSELGKGGDAGALRVLERSGDRLRRAVAEMLAQKPSLESLELRLSALRADILDVGEAIDRAHYQAEVVEVQATLTKEQRGNPRSGLRSRLRRQAAELRLQAEQRALELKLLEEEQALLTAVMTAVTEQAYAPSVGLS